MQILRTIAELRVERAKAVSPVGLVPTMGFLHEGHLALVRAARQENETVLVSIFVNPTQFGPKEDLASYPRDLPRDLDLLERNGADAVFCPTSKEMYPTGYNSFVEVEGITDRLEGASRPGHFRGVATVVAKLFNLFQPDRAYFGQKDFQQTAVIRRMVNDLNFPLELRIMPTVREADGLAMSSRNTYLTPDERRIAPLLYQSLRDAHQSWLAGETDSVKLKETVKATLLSEPGFTLDYVSLADPLTLEEATTASSGSVVSIAARLGKTRLIDNIVF